MGVTTRTDGDYAYPAETQSAPVDGSEGYFMSNRLDSPRSVEACKRIGIGLYETDLLSQDTYNDNKRQSSEGSVGPRGQQRPQRRRKREKEASATVEAAIRAEHHEINRHRLLREVWFMAAISHYNDNWNIL